MTMLTMKTELDEALDEIRTGAIGRRKKARPEWNANGYQVPGSVGRIVVAVRRGRLKIGEIYDRKAVKARARLERMDMLNLMFDLAIWRAPVRFRELPHEREQEKRYRLELRAPVGG